MVIKCHGLRAREGDVHFYNETKDEEEIKEKATLEGSVNVKYNNTDKARGHIDQSNDRLIRLKMFRIVYRRVICRILFFNISYISVAPYC